MNRLVTLVGVAALVATTLAPQRGARGDGYLEGSHATGEWAGVRPALQERGIDVGLVYTSDFGRSSGRDSQAPAFSYLALIDGWLDLDGARLGLWPGVRFFFGVQNAHSYGRDGLEPFQLASNIDTSSFTQLGELFVEQRFADGAFWIRIGKQDSNRDFGSPRYPGNFINDAFGDLPTIPMPSHPAAALGVAAAWRFVDPIRIVAGGFEGNPQPGGWGVTTALEDERGQFAIAALELLAGPRDGAPPIVRHSLGVWYHSADPRQATPESLEPPPGNQGAFLSLDQRFFPHGDDGGSLQVFGRGAITRATFGQAAAYAGAGVAYHGFGTRDDDTVGTGASTVWIEQLEGRKAESSLELFYKARFTRFLSLQPDLQLFRHPQGLPGNGWAVTLRLRIKA